MPTKSSKPAPAGARALEQWRAVASDEAAKQQARDAFNKHTRDTSSMDVLERCKKLNEFLSKEFLTPPGGQPGGGGSKADLQSILAILGTGPKRPACLDKPPVFAQPSGPAGGSSGLANIDAGKLLDLIGLDEEETGQCSVASSSAPSSAASSSVGSHSGSTSASATPCAPEDVDDLIGLLNAGHPAAGQMQQGPDEAEVRRREAEQEQERLRQQQQQQQEEEARVRRQQEELKQKQAEEAQQRAQREEEERRRRQQEEEEKQRRQREQEEQQRRQREQEDAARKQQEELARLQKQREAQEAERQRAAQRGAAACVLQAAVRALLARRQLAQARALHGVRRAMAARCIQRAWRAWWTACRTWNLGPLRACGTRPPTAPLQAGSAAQPVRLRAPGDARTAPRESSSSGCEGERWPREQQHRAVAGAQARSCTVQAEEARQRGDVATRTVMAASEHRDTAAAIAAARHGSLH